MNSYSFVYSIYDFNPFVKRIFLIAFHRSVHKQNKKKFFLFGCDKRKNEKITKKERNKKIKQE